MDKIDQLVARITQNLQDYHAQIKSGFGKQEIIDMAGKINAMNDAHYYLTEHHAFTYEDAEYLLQFKKPLEIVADRWNERVSDLSDMSFDLEKIFNDRSAEADGYELIGADAVGPSVDEDGGSSEKPRKPTLLDRRLAEHEFSKTINKLLPDVSPTAIESWISHAYRSEGVSERPAAQTFSALIAQFSFAKEHFGVESATQAFHVALEMPIPTSEIPSAAAFLKSGGDINDIIEMSLNGKLKSVPEIFAPVTEVPGQRQPAGNIDRLQMPAISDSLLTDDVFADKMRQLIPDGSPDALHKIMSYSALSKGYEQSGFNYEKIVKWLGEDFDGVIVFDEAHNMANSIATKGKRGIKKASQRGMAGLAIQEALPKAKIVYSSATGATEVENLRYAERLGLWGEGTAFPNGDDFVHKVKAGGLAAMELIARDMKATGVYLSRNISYEDVVYDKIVHELTPEQRQIYDELARSWQIVLQNIQQALKTTNQALDGTAKGKAYGAFWGAEQRFFNQILTAMQVPSMMADMQKQLDGGNSIVVQLVSTNEAAQEREFSRLQEQDLELDDFDLTPKQMLMSYIENSFPIYQFEEYQDDNGNIKSKPVYDSENNPVINREALRQKEMLLDKLGSIKVPSSALDMIVNHFGADMVAENTGRKRRVVVKDGKAKEENISHKKEADVTAFQNGDKRIIVFSKAGGTGKSYHADKAAKNQQHRVHYLLQAGWQADAAVQGFGRSHRSNQASAPSFVLVTTDLKGQMRFISTIAKRLDQLGALTKGQRQTGSQGLFTAGDNLENAFAADVLASFYKALAKNCVGGVPDGKAIIEKLGLKDKLLDEYGCIITTATELREVNKFLNRILSLESGEQNAVFDGYAERLQAATEKALQEGTLDRGLENYHADKIVLKESKDIRVDEITGATTKYYSLTAHNKTRPLLFGEVNTQSQSFMGFYLNENIGAVRAVFKTSSMTDEYGNVTDHFRLTGQDGNEYIPQSRLENNWRKLTDKTAGELWKAAVAELPEFRTHNLHLIGGTVLPVWNKLPTESVRIYRVLTSDGEMLIGRVIPEYQIDDTLYKLGATREKENIRTEDLLKCIKYGDTVHLENGWRITQRKVSNEQRIEIIGADYLHSGLLGKKGVFTERIAYQTRYFIPAEKDTIRILGEVVKISPVSRVESGKERAGAKAHPSVAAKGQPERVSAKGRPSLLADLRAAVASVKPAQGNAKKAELSI